MQGDETAGHTLRRYLHSQLTHGALSELAVAAASAPSFFAGTCREGAPGV